MELGRGYGKFHFNYVKNKVEKSVLSKEIVPLFLNQEWIKNLITREINPFVLEQKESHTNWNIEEIENLILQKNHHRNRYDCGGGLPFLILYYSMLASFLADW